MGRKDISVIAKFSTSGNVTPISILWEDGRTFEIDHITDIRKAASLKAGGIGMRYTCMIRNRQRYIYKDEDKWFMETEVK